MHFENEWTIVPKSYYLNYHMRQIMVLRRTHYDSKTKKLFRIKNFTLKEWEATLYRIRLLRYHSRKEADFDLILPNGCISLAPRRIKIPQRFVY